ncbi:ATP synthase subunit 4 [Delphinella strobiligena]|nr:ATP synthase subunit 4 [Delphinella strobiligena]
MASRVARSVMGAARARPTAFSFNQHTLPAVQARLQSNQPVPEQKAKSILDSLPGSNLLSKTAILSAGAGVSIAAISNELYVVNEESIVLLCLLSVYTGIAIYGGPAYKEWAEGQNNKIKNILNTARKEHTSAVQKRIEGVKDLGGVVEITKNLFEVSKETARLEAQAYELEQKTALAAEAKSVLDSWVRYEGQVKVRQQKELAESIIAKIEKELENPKTLDQILKQSIADVEKIVAKQA